MASRMVCALIVTLAVGVGISRVAGAGAKAAGKTGPGLSKAKAQAIYEKFKGLEGTWKSHSTKGWKEQETYRTIAGGSCVMQTSFDAHPNETMVTMIHPDGDRLMLTHYCMAKNQPRLLATEYDEAKGKVTFSFFDATNLPSRDRGHMDKVVYIFDGSDRFSSQWTWYQDGRESWMEEIIHERVEEAREPIPTR